MNSICVSPHHSVSVVMCTYNGEKFLREQLDSIIAQTYPIDEIIVQDNQSTDTTMDILKEYAQRYSNIKIYTRPQFTYSIDDDKIRQTINDNFFSAIEKANGDYIAISDQDDIWVNTKVEEQMHSIGNHLCCFHLSPSFSARPNYNYTDKRAYNYGLERLLFFGAIPGHTMLIDKNLYVLLQKHIFVNTLHQITNSCCYDTILGCIATSYGSIVYIPKALSFHRIHTSNASVAGITRRDCSKRNVKNALHLVSRNLNPQLRRQLSPIIRRRLTNINLLLNSFPDAPRKYTNEAYKMIRCYTGNNIWNKYVYFTWLAIRNRNKIFYAAEKNQAVAILRALLFPITMYDAFWSDYNRLKK